MDITQAQDLIQKRFNRNLIFFKENIPAVYQQIISNQKPLNLSIDPKTSTLFKTSEGVAVYQPSPVDHAQKEVTDFFKIIDRSDYRPLPSTLMLFNLIKNKPFIKTVEKYARGYVTSRQKKPYHADLVVFGVGLGYHIEMLCNKKAFYHITIIENNIDNLKESLYTIDWGEILKELPANRKISFIIKDEKTTTEDFHRGIQFQLQNNFPAISSATMIYNHLGGEDFIEEKLIIKDLINYVNVVYEKIAPDAQRLMNVNENCKRKVPVINIKKTSIGKSNSIAIIGAGPSLDNYIEILKKNKEKFIIISCGSSLSSLLNNGITPNYHFELEFKVLATKLLEFVNEKHPLKNIELICSLEAQPNFIPLFKKSHAFLPETTELSNRIGVDYILPRGGITCTNGATAFATCLGEGDIYLFGLDFAQTNGNHHAKDNITNKINLPKSLHELEKDGAELVKRASIETMDVFGEKVLTTPSLNAARLLIETLIKQKNNTFYNCSNGSKIEGSQRLSKEELSSMILHNDNSENAIDFIENTFEINKIKNMTKEILNISLNVSNQIRDILTKAASEDLDQICIKINNITNSIKNETGEFSGQHRSIMSINRLPIYLLFVVVNFTEKEKRKEILEAWLLEYEEYIEFLRDKLIGHIEKNDFNINEDWTENI